MRVRVRNVNEDADQSLRKQQSETFWRCIHTPQIGIPRSTRIGGGVGPVCSDFASYFELVTFSGMCIWSFEQRFHRESSDLGNNPDRTHSVQSQWYLLTISKQCLAGQEKHNSVAKKRYWILES